MRFRLRWLALAWALCIGLGPTAQAREPVVAEDDLEAEAPPPAVKPKTKGQKARTGLKLDALRAEAGGFTDEPGVNGNGWLHAAVSARWQPEPGLEMALGARVDGYAHSGGPRYREGRLDYTENYLRWRGEASRITLGTQNILWGRVDEVPPVDRLSRADLSRGILDKLAERRRAVPAVRLEHFAGDYKLDAVWLPIFVPAVLPEMDSVWHPVNRRSGRVLGIEDSPALAAMISAATFRHKDGGGGGGGVRLTASGGPVDWGLSLQRVRQSLPYYRLSAGPPAPVFTAVHPYSWVAGGELELQHGGATWRLEAAYSSATPLTRRADLRYVTEPAADLVLGVEFHPGDADTRLTLQWSGHRSFTDQPVLDRSRRHGLGGEIEHPFAQGRWRLNVRFYAGLDRRDYYLNPRLSFLGFEPHEIYLGLHHFSGESGTLGGFYRDNDLVVAGWAARF